MIHKKTYKDHVVEHLYKKLQSGELSSGAQVLESRLAEELGISRAPIREALQQLVAGGLLEYRPQVGHFVTSLSAQEIMDAYLARGLLEGYAIAEALESFDAVFLGQLQKLCQQMEEFADDGLEPELIEAGREFHALLFKRCENLQVVDYTERLSAKLHLLFYRHWASLYDATEIRLRHEELLAVIRQRDPFAVELAFRQHYAETGRKVARLYSNPTEAQRT